MAAINDLIRQITDPDLRDRIQKEVDKLAKQKKFGLVFEEHLPECTPLYDIPVRRGVKAALKAGDVSDFYQVLKVDDGKAICIKRGETEAIEFPVDDLVTIAEFGEPIYPYLKPIDAVCNAPDSDLWHTLIEADNYHALQLLEYLYAGKVDCIYIDPPYNTGARDWKYNNDFIDSNDTYRHSKWLSMMQRRLRLARNLLNPKESVLIITIDEKEYLHLGCLLEELFPEARMQMISSVIKPEGTQRRNEFSRTNEFLFFVMFGDAIVPTYTNAMFETGERTEQNNERRVVEWSDLRRRNRANIRSSRPNQFYPIFINKQTGFIDSIGDVLKPEQDRMTIIPPENCYAAFPVAPDGREMLWGKHCTTARILLEKGYIKAEKGKDPSKVKIKYLPEGIESDIESGNIRILGYGEQGEIIGEYVDETKYFAPKSVWNMASHNAQTFGSLILKSVIGENRFTFPKSLYAVKDCIGIFTANKPEALIVDFFAGSGTTLHAVNLLNLEDDGKRRCILVTNNEVSDEEAKSMSSKGLKPGDIEWEEYGIAHYVTWPRTVSSITGKDVFGLPIKGNYLGSDRPMADGFPVNASFFKLGFLDKTAVSLGMQFREMLPVLWMKAGAIGKMPEVNEPIPDMLIFPQNKFAVLINENAFASFEKAVNDSSDIQTVFIVTDYEVNYRAMIKNLNVETSYQLYRDYLDNFRINHGRN